MTATNAVKNLIRQGKYGQIATTMLTGTGGMQNFAVSLKNLRNEGKITDEIYKTQKNLE